MIKLIRFIQGHETILNKFEYVLFQNEYYKLLFNANFTKLIGALYKSLIKYLQKKNILLLVLCDTLNLFCDKKKWDEDSRILALFLPKKLWFNYRVGIKHAIFLNV